MPGAIFRVRSRIKKNLSLVAMSAEEAGVFQRVLDMIDEELERDAEFEFTRPMNPDPVTTFAKGNKDADR